MNGKVDWKHAHAAVGGSPELLVEIIDIFLDQYPTLISGIQSSIESQAATVLRQQAHSLKGSLRYFGPTRAVELALELEIMGRDKQMERAAAVFAELQAEAESLVPELKAFAASHSPDSGA